MGGRTTLVALFALLLCSAVQAAALPAVAGWTPVGETRTYGPDTLWDYIDGGAELYLRYGFRELVCGDVTAGGVTVTVGCYRMDTPLGAFGIYTTERPTDAARLFIGSEAVLTLPYQCLMWKGSSYVKVEMFEGQLGEEQAKALLQGLAAALPGEVGLPEEFKALPANGRLQGSEGFAADRFLGLEELGRCLFARYRDQQGKEYTVFRLLPEEGKSDDAAWSALSSGWTAAADAPGVLTREVAPYGLVGLKKSGKTIFGVAGAASAPELLARLAEL